MARLRALDLPGGSDFLTELQRAWDDGDAVLPVDQRLPPAARDQLLSALRPHQLVTADDRIDLDDGIDTAPDDALVMATSGTTGAPKGVVLTHQAIRASAEATSAALAVDLGHDRWLACLPLSHIGGMSVVTRALHTGVDLEIHSGFDAAAVVEAGRRGATLVSLVPTVLDRLDVGDFRTVLLGGSAIPVDRPPNCVATYGMTETGSGIVYDGQPLAGVDLRIVDGEVQVRGPMLLRAYRDGSSPVDDDGWLATGDAGALSDDGELTVFGRAGDLIITGGENVWPIAVEAVLTTHPLVSEVLIVGRAHVEWGHQVTAQVVAVDAAAPPTLDQLRDHTKEQLPAYCAPREVEIVAALPRTPSGKLIRPSLR